jgi:hypothetical protein
VNEPFFSAKDVRDQAGSNASNKSATAHRWKREGKIFAVKSADGDRFPAFQLKDGRPLPVISDVLKLLREQMTDWQIAFWFTSANPSLQMRRPADCLDERDAVVSAARREAEFVTG